MRHFVPTTLLLVALVHALPLVGVLGPKRLARLYGIPAAEPNLEILLRHRAVLFGLLAAFLAWAAFKPELHRLALISAVLSVSSFLGLAMMVGNLNAELRKVFKVDVVALVLLLAACAAHLRAV